VYTDLVNIPYMKAVTDTQQLNSVKGSSSDKKTVTFASGESRDEWPLECAKTPCSCTHYRGIATGSCPYEHTTNCKPTKWVYEEAKPVPTQRQPASVEETTVYADLKNRLKIDGNLTKKDIAE
jgi:hypothetical protein